MVLGVIGVGRMGAALCAGLAENRVFSSRRIVIYDRDGSRVEALAARFPFRSVGSIIQLARLADACLLAIKPQDRAEVTAGLKEAGFRGPLFSILAGIPTTYFEGCLGRVPVVRVMPNLGVQAGAGMSCYCLGSFAGDTERALAARIFGGVGETLEVTEAQMNTVTALSGSGPAYFFLMMEALVEYGREHGLSEEGAVQIVRQTVLACALLTRCRTPGRLREEVASPGGTTEAALAVLREKCFSEAMKAALEAAEKRGRELASGTAEPDLKERKHDGRTTGKG